MLPDLVEDDDTTYVPEVEIPVDEAQESEPLSKHPKLLFKSYLTVKRNKKTKEYMLVVLCLQKRMKLNNTIKSNLM